jgi:hypothetical protein
MGEYYYWKPWGILLLEALGNIIAGSPGECYYGFDLRNIITGNPG